MGIVWYRPHHHLARIRAAGAGGREARTSLSMPLRATAARCAASLLEDLSLLRCPLAAPVHPVVRLVLTRWSDLCCSTAWASIDSRVGIPSAVVQREFGGPARVDIQTS
jgi:hypothetical protein